MKKSLSVFFVLLTVLCVLTGCATPAARLPVPAEDTDAAVVQETAVPASQIVFKGDAGKFELVLCKDDMSAKLYKLGIQIKEGYWTSTSIGYSSNIQIFIDEKPVNLFIDPITNEYSFDYWFDSTSDVLRCDMNSWMGKVRKFTSLKESSGEIILYGASNFAYWDTAVNDLNPYLVHNHAVGGVTDSQLLASAPELLYPYSPKVVLLLAGSNEYANITDVSDPESIANEMMATKVKMYEEFHANLPETRFVAVAGMPTVKRSLYTEIILKVNGMMEQYCSEHPDFMTYCSLDGLTYDTASATYKSERFLADDLHLTPEARIIMANEYLLPVLEKIDAPKGAKVMEPVKHMLYDSVDEIPYYDGKADEPYFISYQIDSDKPAKAILIFHGGGFRARSVPKEAEEIAEYFSRVYGYACFACYYRINTDYRAIVSDGIRFVKEIRANAEEFNIDPDQICLMGFSAGGNLALMESEHYLDAEYAFADEINDVDGRPDYLCLVYPGSSLEGISKLKSFNIVYSEEFAEKYDTWRNIPEDMGSVFIAHSQDDNTASVDSSYRLAAALEEKGVDYELNVFSKGDHGFALGNNEETVRWTKLFASWFDER